MTTGEEFFHYGSFLDNITLPHPGERRMYLTVIDKCGNTGQVYSTIVVSPQDTNKEIALNVDIIAHPIIGDKNLLVDYDSIVHGGTSPFQYFWQFGDGGTGLGKITSHIFTTT